VIGPASAPLIRVASAPAPQFHAGVTAPWRLGRNADAAEIGKAAERIK